MCFLACVSSIHLSSSSSSSLADPIHCKFFFLPTKQHLQAIHPKAPPPLPSETPFPKSLRDFLSHLQHINIPLYDSFSSFFPRYQAPSLTRRRCILPNPRNCVLETQGNPWSFPNKSVSVSVSGEKKKHRLRYDFSSSLLPNYVRVLFHFLILFTFSCKHSTALLANAHHPSACDQGP